MLWLPPVQLLYDYNKQVLHGALEKGQDLSDGRAMAARFLGRTIQTDLENVSIDSNGVRLNDFAMAHYNTESDQREVVEH